MSKLVTFQKGDSAKLTTNFFEYEFAEHGDHDHEQMIDYYFVLKLQKFRDRHNIFADNGLLARIDNTKDVSFTINSGYRCKIYNDGIKNADPNSQHIYGIAADVKINNVKNIRYDKVALLAYDHGFTGIGIYSNRIHLDIRDPRGLPFGVAFWDKR